MMKPLSAYPTPPLFDASSLLPWHNSQEAVVTFLINQNPPASRQLLQAFKHSVGSRGKLIRPTLGLLMLEALSGDSSQQLSEADPRIQLVAVSELIHLATLLHDDVLDEADTRRGKPTVRFTLGNHTAILAGDFLLAKASGILADLGNLEIVRIYSNVLAALCDGELLQHELCFDATASTWERYQQKNHGKTGSLFAATLESVGRWLGYPNEACLQLHAAGLDFGMAFQLTDDLLDYSIDAATLGKPVLDDARHGIVNAPLLFALEESPELDGILQGVFTLAQAVEGDTTYTTDALETACQQLKQGLLQTQTLEKTKALASDYTEKALTTLKSLLPDRHSPAFEVLAQLMRANTQRQS
jgi:geranylgeranyl pyrophosphate synthase